MANQKQLPLICKLNTFKNEKGDTIEYAKYYVNATINGQTFECELKPVDSTVKKILLSLSRG